MRLRLTNRHGWLLLFAVICWIALSASLVSALTIGEVKAEIAREGQDWIAGETAVSRLSALQQRQLLGGLPTPSETIDFSRVWRPSNDESLARLS